MSDIEAVLISDIHISHRPPIARSEEKCWYSAQSRVFEQVKKIADGCPIVCGGDLFHDGKTPSKCPPEMINWCMDNLPVMYSVCGNHDLPHHLIGNIEKSPFWTLVKAKKLVWLDDPNPWQVTAYDIRGFSWGKRIEKPKGEGSYGLAVCHRYIWKDGCGFPDAPPENKVENLAEELEGYDCSLWGDNHTTFLHTFPNGHNLFNPGSLMRRNSDQVNHKPCVGKLYSDGRIEIVYLDTSADILTVKEERLRKTFHEQNESSKEFLDELFGLAETGIDFGQVIDNFIVKSPNLPERTKMLLIQLTENT